MKRGALSLLLCSLWVGACALAPPLPLAALRFWGFWIAPLVMLAGRGLINWIVCRSLPRPPVGTWSDAELEHYARSNGFREGLEWTSAMLALFLMLLPRPVRFPWSLIMVWLGFALVVAFFGYRMARRSMHQARDRALPITPAVFD